MRLEQNSRWILLADFYDPREPEQAWGAGTVVSVEGISLLKGGEILFRNEKTGDKRWATMEAFERALTLDAVTEFDE